MEPVSFKKIALSVHRWVGLILAPLFFLIVVSGGILAVKPILEDPRISGIPQSVDTTRLIQTLDNVDPFGRANRITVSGNGQSVAVQFKNRRRGADGNDGEYSIVTGRKIAEGRSDTGFFKTVEKFHKEFLIDADFLVEFCAYGMLAIIVLGPFLSWLRFRNTVSGWHMAAGWISLPFILVAPLTAVMLLLHIGQPEKAEFRGSRSNVSIARGLEEVLNSRNIKTVVSARKFRGGIAVEVETVDGNLAAYSWDGKSVPQPFAEGSQHLVKSIHEGTWAGAWSGLLNLAISLVLAILTGTGFYSWLRRRRQSNRRSGSTDADVLVAYASQTGTAAKLAEATYEALKNSDVKTALASLGGLLPEELEQYKHILIIASTTGEGELAEPGRGFVKALRRAEGLKASFAILALGDRRYRHFCAGGEMVEEAMTTAGGKKFLDMVRVDGAPQAAWREWLDRIRESLSIDLGEVSAPEADMPVHVRLVERSRLDNYRAEDSGETWQILFSVKEDVFFRPGDLLMLSPGEHEPERCYSIGSSALTDARRIRLTVNLHRWTDDEGQEHLGQMSQFLCHGLPEKIEVKGFIRRHAYFNPPDDISTPIVMLSAGCGIAPFPGFLEEREARKEAAGESWLLFGNRHREGDFLYRKQLIEWRSRGVLTHLCTSFSRDGDDGRYVTDELVANGGKIVPLLRDKGGILYVCGRPHLREGIEKALVGILMHTGKMSEAEAGDTIRNWREKGTIREDLFE